jgi:hypothetical protein
MIIGCWWRDNGARAPIGLGQLKEALRSPVRAWGFSLALGPGASLRLASLLGADGAAI